METKPEKILVVSSPTGGHLYPAIEVSRQLLNSGGKIIFVTQQQSKFIDLIKDELNLFFLVPNNFLVIETVPAAKFSRDNPIKILIFLFSTLKSFIKSIRILLIHRPNLIFSTGGYTSISLILVSKLFFPKMKIVLQEQNYVLGLTNKFLSVFADKICCGFPVEKKFNSKKYIFTGNPIREKFKLKTNKEQIYKKFGFDKQKFTLLIFGGSQGAKRLNDEIINILKVEGEKLKNVQVIHITGSNDFVRMKNEYNDLKTKNVVLPYLSNMEEAYIISDLIISRAGAMTISELIYFKKPAILVPFPFATEFHQNWNAQYLKTYGCALVVYQKNDFGKKLKETLVSLMSDKNKLEMMKKNFDKLSFPKNTIIEVLN